MAKNGDRLHKPWRAIVLGLAVAAGLALPSPVHAADSTRTGGAGDWADDLEWDNGTPGDTSGTTNADTATFNSAGGTVVVDTYRNLMNLTLDGGTTAGWTFTTGTFYLTGDGKIEQINAGSNTTNTFSAALVLLGDYSILNNSTNNSRVLKVTTGGITGTASTGNTQTLTLGGTGTSSSNQVSGVIGDGAGGGALAVTKAGSGTWTLVGDNTFTGNLKVLAGQVRYDRAAAVGGGTIYLGDTSGNLDATLYNVNGTAFTTANNVIVQSGNTGTVTYGLSAGGTTNANFNGSITLGSADGDGHGITLAKGGNYGFVRFNGVIQDPTGMTAGTAGVVTITGGSNGPLALFGTNTYSGGTLLDNGKLSLNNPSALGTGTLTVDGGHFGQLYGAFGNTQNNTMIWNTNFTSDGNLTVDMGSGSVDLGATGSDTTLVLTINNTGNTSYTGFVVRGTISDGSNGQTVNLTKAGTGVLSLGGTSDYTGSTTIQRGTLKLVVGDDRLPTGTELIIEGNDTYGGALDLNTRNQTVAKLSGGSGTVQGVVTNGASGSGTNTLTVTGTGTFDGVIEDGATRKVALTKSTGGELILTSDNTYTGVTQITGGRLTINGSLANTAVSVTGGTLGGTGTIAGGVTTTAAGTIAPGNSIASLHTGTLDMTAGGTLSAEVDTENDLSDTLAIGGNLLLSGNTAVLSLSNLGADVEATAPLTLISYTGIWDAGTFMNLANGATLSIGSFNYTIDYNADLGGGTSGVTLTAVPEPGTFGLIGLAGATLLARRRRNVAPRNDALL